MQNNLMTSEREKANRWWCFDTRDLLLLTALAAASLAAIRLVNWVWPGPFWINAACTLSIAGAIIGGLARQFWGGLAGTAVGGLFAGVIVVAGRLLGY